MLKINGMDKFQKLFDSKEMIDDDNLLVHFSDEYKERNGVKYFPFTILKLKRKVVVFGEVACNRKSYNVLRMLHNKTVSVLRKRKFKDGIKIFPKIESKPKEDVKDKK